MADEAEEYYPPTPPPPARTLEGREEQMIAAAMDLVEERIYKKSASAQETVHFLKLGSVRNQLEQEKLRNEVTVLKARVKEMESRKTSEEMYTRALAAMRGYAGLDEPSESSSDEEDPYHDY